MAFLGCTVGGTATAAVLSATLPGLVAHGRHGSPGTRPETAGSGCPAAPGCLRALAPKKDSQTRKRRALVPVYSPGPGCRRRRRSPGPRLLRAAVRAAVLRLMLSVPVMWSPRARCTNGRL